MSSTMGTNVEEIKQYVKAVRHVFYCGWAGQAGNGCDSKVEIRDEKVSNEKVLIMIAA